MDELLLDNRIAGLIIKYLQNDITETEYQELQTWMASSDRAKEIFEELTSEEKLPAEIVHYSHSRRRILEKIHAAEPETRVVVEMNKRINWKPWLAAAVMIGIALMGYWWVMMKNAPDNIQEAVAEKTLPNDAAPAKEGAILRLADGTEIVLNEKQDGAIADHVTKEGGKLIYGSADGAKPEMHLMTTSKGQTYRVMLSDGSVVWLNAASSLYYPASFGDERRVEVTGEAYFEIAKDAARKFIVVTNGVSMEVLGTSFNVNTYDDAADAKVTLLTGRIQVNTAANSVVLKPGQQASVDRKDPALDEIKLITGADLEQVMAWKNGLFKFNSTPLTAMMKEMERWYNVDIEYAPGVNKGDKITGTISRNYNASEALTLLQTAGYKFKIEGKKITVQP